MLDEQRIPIHYLAGTSAGALVGGLYAAGISPRRMVEIMRKLKWSSISSLNWRSFSFKAFDLGSTGLPLGLFDMDKLISYLDGVLGGPVTFNVSMAQEYIPLSQRVEAYRLEAWDGQAWKVIAHGTTIGHKKLDRFPDVTASKVRLSIDKSLAPPLIRSFGLYHTPALPS